MQYALSVKSEQNVRMSSGACAEIPDGSDGRWGEAMREEDTTWPSVCKKLIPHRTWRRKLAMPPRRNERATELAKTFAESFHPNALLSTAKTPRHGA